MAALPPIALGHAIAVAVVVAIVAGVRVALPLDVLRVVIAVALVMLGGYRLWRHRHPRFGGMQVGFRDLTVWSFLMASAHGAGLMLVPFVIETESSVSAVDMTHAHHALAASSSNGWVDVMAVGLHSLSYVLVSTLIAWVVYRRLGVAFLRVAWFNLDWVWAGALVITGVLVVMS